MYEFNKGPVHTLKIFLKTESFFFLFKTNAEKMKMQCMSIAIRTWCITSSFSRTYGVFLRPHENDKPAFMVSESAVYVKTECKMGGENLIITKIIYSGTTPYRHLANTVTLLLPPLFLRPTKRPYSRTCLIRTQKGQNQVSALQRCHYFRGRECRIFGIPGTKRTIRNGELSVL